MGCLPLADLCLSLAELHHFCLTKGFPKTPMAIQPIGMLSVFCIQLSLTPHPNTRGAYFESFVSDQLFSVLLVA